MIEKKMIDMIDFNEVASEAMYCMKCGLCRAVLPSELKSDRFHEVCPSGSEFLFEAYFAPGRCEIARAIIREEFNYEDSPKLLHAIYTCTNCGACDIQCRFATSLGRTQPAQIVEALRAKLVNDGIGPMPKQKAYGKSVVENHNPYHEKHEDRLNWLGSKKIPEKAEVMYFVGCTSSYRNSNIANATYDVLKNIGADFTISNEEFCCGSPLLRTGQLDKAEEVMKHNIELIEKMGVKKIIFSCAGCYRTFSHDYPKYVGKMDVEFKHISQELADLLDKGELKLNNLDLKATYHDPCHLGKHMYPDCVYDQPRKVLKGIPGVELLEMERIKDVALCCGAGGGVKSSFPEFALHTSKKRLEEALETGAEALISTCPFCWNNFNDGIKADNLGIKMYDLTQIVKLSIEGGGMKK